MEPGRTTQGLRRKYASFPISSLIEFTKNEKDVETIKMIRITILEFVIFES
jgi:hypothetical protein